MFFAKSNYAQFNDPWGGGGGTTGQGTQQGILTPVDGDGTTPTQPTFGGNNTFSPSQNTSPGMTTFGGPAGPPGGGGGNNDNTVPIDGGLTILLTVGIGKGLKSYRSKKQKQQTANLTK